MLSYFTLSQFRKTKFSCYHVFVFIFFLTLTSTFHATNVYSAQVVLTWKPNSESDLAGYKIYYGNLSGIYDTSIDVGNQTIYTLSNLMDGNTYYLALTAYNFSRNESDYTEELIHSVPVGTIPPTLISVNANGSDVPVTIGTNDTLSVEISLDAGSSMGEDYDWWVVVNTPSGWYYYNLTPGTFTPGLLVSYQGALFNLGSTEIFNTSGLAAGIHSISP